MGTFNIRKRVALIQRDDTLRKKLRVLIEAVGQYRIIMEDSGYDNLVHAIGKFRSGIVIMDLQMEGCDAIEVIRSIRKRSIHSKILILSEHMEVALVVACFKAGASGYIIKRPEVEYEIPFRLSELCDGGAPLSSEISRIIVASFHENTFAGLTGREREVLKLLALGKSSTRISKELRISINTSKSHIKNIYAKLNVNRRDQAIAKGIIRIAQK